jgi:hypothetical protein
VLEPASSFLGHLLERPDSLVLLARQFVLGSELIKLFL